MNLDTLLSTIILVSFLVTILMAVGSYVAYKLRESRRPRDDDRAIDGESPFFEIVRPADETISSPGPRA
jgi:hypothetical protein